MARFSKLAARRISTERPRAGDQVRLAVAARIRDLCEVHTGRCRDVCLMAAKGWQKRFEDPIEISGRKSLVTLKDAADYVTRLPKAEHESPQWQAAIEALIMAAVNCSWRHAPFRRTRAADACANWRHAASRSPLCGDPLNSASKSSTISWSKRAAIGSVVSCARMR